ncbi:uncharacterized protein [Pyrus communis]|uniref:uncharacterized protein n=1 Tax=Pyrus communis TaxID=23211 RepID=UPI0035BFB5CF
MTAWLPWLDYNELHMREGRLGCRLLWMEGVGWGGVGWGGEVRLENLGRSHHSTWKKAGIHEAIFSSTYQIKRQTDLVFGFAEKWSCETNTFIFPWGEATITLEDVMLVQVWAWERFSDLRPENPNPLNYGEPRMARWDTSNRQKVKNLRRVLDSAREEFMWRPYALDVVENWHCLNTILKRKSGFRLDLIRMMNYSHLFRCLRVSELVGLNGAIEHYLPRRVAMQFGYDQDLPGSVTQLKHKPDTAWKNYIEEAKKVKMYLPSRLFKVDVSSSLNLDSVSLLAE